VTELVEVLDDLRAEFADLDRLVSGLTPEQWALPTPAPRWTVAHQIAHLSWTDDQITLAATDPHEFRARLTGLLADPEHFVDRGAEETLAAPAELLTRWRQSRARVIEALTAMPDGTRHPWYGTSMGSRASATGRLMETWAHGEDIATTVGELRLPTVRLRHVAFLGSRTLGHSFVVNGLPAPTAEVYLELAAPDGATWAYGSPDAEDRVVGPALDFCLLVVQRLNRADTALQATGPVADAWLDVAQAFAGPPGAGRPATASDSGPG
jgi:uncharacterized protein (TIGR03084 family)